MSRACLKFSIVFFNVFIMLIGAAALGIGIWVLVNDQDFIDETTDVLDLSILGDDLLETCAMAMITAGAIVFVLGALGCVGAFALSSFVLVFYSLALIVVLTVEVAVLVLVIVYRSEIRDKIDDEVVDRLETDYGDRTKSFTKSFDALQDEFECCGWEDGTDFNNVNRNVWNVTMETGEIRKVPDACCVSSNETLVSACVIEPFNNNTIYSNQGCKDEVEDKLEEYIWVIIGVTAGLLGFQFLLISLSLCLVAKNAGKNKYNM